MSLIKLSVFHIFTATTSNYRYDKPTVTLTVLDLVTLRLTKLNRGRVKIVEFELLRLGYP